MVCYYLICKLDYVEKPIYKLCHTYVCAGLIVVTGSRRIYLLAVVIDCCFVIKCSVIKFILVTSRSYFVWVNLALREFCILDTVRNDTSQDLLLHKYVIRCKYNTHSCLLLARQRVLHPSFPHS